VNKDAIPIWQHRFQLELCRGADPDTVSFSC
jgi:hypothetical protein